MCTYLYYSTGSEETCWYCSNCDYSATTASNLKRRVKNKHKGVRYPCSRWEHGATDTGNLKKHVENNHEGVRHPYDQTLLIPMIGSCWVHSLSFWQPATGMYHEGSGVKHLCSRPVWTPGRYLHSGVGCPEGSLGVPLWGPFQIYTWFDIKQFKNSVFKSILTNLRGSWRLCTPSLVTLTSKTKTSSIHVNIGIKRCSWKRWILSCCFCFNIFKL